MREHSCIVETCKWSPRNWLWLFCFPFEMIHHFISISKPCAFSVRCCILFRKLSCFQYQYIYCIEIQVMYHVQLTEVARRSDSGGTVPIYNITITSPPMLRRRYYSGIFHEFWIDSFCSELIKIPFFVVFVSLRNRFSIHSA